MANKIYSILLKKATEHGYTENELNENRYMAVYVTYQNYPAVSYESMQALKNSKLRHDGIVSVTGVVKMDEYRSFITVFAKSAKRNRIGWILV